MANKQEITLYDGEVTIVFYPDSHRYKLQGERSYLPSVTSITGIIDKSRFLIPWAVGLYTMHIRQELETRTVEQFSREEILMIAEEGARAYEVKREKAASIGDEVHNWVEAFGRAQIEGAEMPEIPTESDERVVNGINAFLEWFNANEVQFRECERFVYSKEHGYCGKVDAIAAVNGKKCLLDYKTSKGIYDEYRLQVAGYAQAFCEEIISQNKAEKVLLETGNPGESKLLPHKIMILHFSKDTGDFATLEIEHDGYLKDLNAFLGCLAVKSRLKELHMPKLQPNRLPGC